MTQKEKELLLRDISARLPYGVICQMEDEMIINDSNFYDYTLSEKHIELFRNHKGFYIKPYLRPLSSMTNDEYKEMNDIIGWHAEINYKYSVNDFEICLSQESDPTIWFGTIIEIQDWLNAHHFDYRGLIPKGLAISTEEFNPYKD